MASRLMIPGPVPLSESVTQALTAPVQAHYGPAWVNIYNQTLECLRQVFQTKGDIFLLVGSGSAGLDAAIGSLIAPGQKALVGVNGYFGQRLVEICRAYGIQAIEVAATWGEPLTAEAFIKSLKENPDVSTIILTHIETSTAVLNPLQEITEVANRHSIPIIVDAISSLGGLDLAMDEWGIDICVAASQKCLGGPAGLTPVAVNSRAWTAIENQGPNGRGWYLNLRVWRDFARRQKDWHPFPVTLPTGAILALREGVQMLLKEGLPQRFRRYRDLAARLRAGLQTLGYRPLAGEAWAAPVVTAAYSLPGIPSSRVVDYLERTHHLKIAGGGLGPLQDKIFRIGHMAPSFDKTDIDAVLDALDDFKNEMSIE